MHGETPTLRRATVGPILAQEFPPASELPFIGITVAEHLALDNARFIAVAKAGLQLKRFFHLSRPSLRSKRGFWAAIGGRHRKSIIRDTLMDYLLALPYGN